jgi:2-polyprenyl-6-hydroxyphenyl methylase/3-demethylubiquinone-9 3-methyltransferase
MCTYKKNRGMAFWTDVKDWLGGWPYEPATQEEIRGFCENELGLELIKIKTGEANIEYLFKRRD